MTYGKVKYSAWDTWLLETYCHINTLLLYRPDVLLIEPDKSEVELGEVRLNAELEQILADEQWIDDATGLVPHCISLLKICHTLTERLTALAMGPLQSSASTSHQIGEVRRHNITVLLLNCLCVDCT